MDVYAGLNVLIILFKLHAAAQHPDYPDVPDDAPAAEINFHPCGVPDTEEFEDDRLLKIIHYADSLSLGTFATTVEPHLSRANLSRALLKGANFYRAVFNGANLNCATFNGASLDSATLSGAFFYSADLASISWNKTTDWTNVYGLQTSKNVPEDLKQQLGLEGSSTAD